MQVYPYPRLLRRIIRTIFVGKGNMTRGFPEKKVSAYGV